MYKIKKQEFIRFVEVEGINLNLIRAEIFCDTDTDLPTADAIDGCRLDMGSIAYVIATGDMYVLNSGGEWKNASGEEQSNALHSSAQLDGMKSINVQPDIEVADTSDSEQPESIAEVDESVELTEEKESEGTGEEMQPIPEDEPIIEVGKDAVRDSENR